jgi:TetR/AcrR family transcriptional repressor of nem operon
MPTTLATEPPLTKGQRTRAEIIRRSARLMNRQGFLAAPMSAVIEATGIQKGGLYRHFASREALAYAALDHAVAEVRERFFAALRGRDHACDQLLAFLGAYEAGDDASAIPFEGGCPIMNAAIESDHAHPGLRQRAGEAMQGWQGLLARIVAGGIRRGEIRADVDADAEASVMIACIEGAVMLSHLHGNATALSAARRHLERHVQRDLRCEEVST